MTNADERIAAALQRDGPPARDTMFRLQVLERRERQRFRRRAHLSLAAAAVMVGMSSLAVNANGETYSAGNVLLFALVLVMAGVVYLPAFGRLLRHFSI